MTGRPAIAAESLSAGYNGVPAVHDLSLEVAAGEMVLLAGPNGAGKSTTVRALSGALAPLAGRVHFDGAPCATPLHRRVRAGLGVVPEQRAIFRGLTVADNLRLGRGDTDGVLTLFPELRGRLRVRAGLLSGGEQQMLALGRVIASRPTVILADEMSLGLAPIVVTRLLAALRAAADSGAAVLLVEQYVKLALDTVDRAYFIKRGRIELSGAVAALRQQSDEIASLYLRGE